jgi:peptide/nickel transport system substrate-binding protein
MYGAPALPPEYTHLPYANPDAPKGGKIVTGEVGSFDSLNPHIRKGNVPWQLRFLAYESLMGRSWDEPFTLYGLLAESVETGPDREWVEFTLREEARFSDGSPVTVEDVMWSYETLGTTGHARYAGAWAKVETMEQTGPRSVRFTFNVDDREVALLMGMRPILKKAQWEGLDFTDSGLDVVPITTAPYVIDEFEAGRFVSLRRNPDYWGKDLPFMRGQANLDEIRLEFFGDQTAAFEAFKAGVLTSNREFNAQKWDTQYDFPRMRSVDVVRSLVPHQRPSGITGFVMNTRRAPFDDWRVRDALIHAFNFEFINQAQTAGKQKRITSYFSNSVLAMRPGPAVGDDGVLRDASGAPFAFELLLQQGNTEQAAIADIYVQALQRLGIAATVVSVDKPQYRERTDTYEFDMTYYRRGASLSPGNEQKLYWGCDGVEAPGTRNWMGMCSAAAEAMIDTMLNAQSRDEFLAAARALDRVLSSGRYVIPFYVYNVSRLAHVKELKFPDTLPIYGDWIRWQPDVWWYEEE